MKQILATFAVIFGFMIHTAASAAQPTTTLYAVKGTDSLYLDHYAAAVENGTPRPCMIFMFGGGFVSGQRNDPRYIPYFEKMNRFGYDVISIDYRLGIARAMAQGTLNEQTFIPTFANAIAMAVEDLFTATAFVLSKAGEWGIDPQGIVSCGSSAGAISVLQGEYQIANRGPLTQILPEGFDYAGVVSFAGAILTTDGTGLKWDNAPAPMLLFHGDADMNVPYDVLREQTLAFCGSKEIARALAEGSMPRWFYSIENADHAVAITPMNENIYEIESFLDKFVQQKLPLTIDTSSRRLDAPQMNKHFTLMDYVRANFGN